MLKILIEKEIKDAVLSTKFAVTFLICSVMILLSFYVGAKNYQVSKQRYEAAVKENLRQLEGLTDWMAVNNFRVFLPPSPLGSLVTGVSNDIGRTVSVSGGTDISAYDSYFNSDPLYAVFRFFDLEFVFTVILSLFAILFAFDSVTGEKEKGTLRLNFANPIPRSTYITGKLTGSLLSFVLPLLLPIGMGIQLLPLLGVYLNGDEFARLSLIILTGLLYLSVFIMLAIFVSTRTTKSSSSFLFSVGIWITAVIILPRVLASASEIFVTVPPLEEINSKKARLSAQLWEEDRIAMNNFRPASTSNPQDVMAEFGKFMDQLGENREKKLKDLNDRLFEERMNAQIRRENIAFGLGSISPATSLSLVTADLAGTSLALENYFRESVLTYKKSYRDFMFAKTGSKMTGAFRFRMVTDDNAEKPKPINPSEMPVYTFSAPSLGGILPGIIWRIGLLAGFCITLFGASWYSFLRYDLR